MPILLSISFILCMSYSIQVHAGLDYNAEPADIWSCGIVLVAMLAGGIQIIYFKF